jgi:hypothetical protein
MRAHGTKGWAVIAATVVACGFWSACSTINPQSVGLSSPVTPREFDKQVVFKDASLTNVLTVTNTDAERRSNGLLYVRVQIFNMARENIACQLQWKFRDKKGFEIQVTSREPHIFKGAQTETLERFSMNEAPVDWVLFIEK